MIRQSNSVKETESIAAELARVLKPGQCVALHGDLGAGKTQFVRGLVRGLDGNSHAVSSPTFVLLNVYDSGRLKVFHLDAYRVHGVDDFETIGFAEMLEQGGVVVVEWAERIEKLLPVDRINVRITPAGETSRRIEIGEEPGLTPPQRQTARISLRIRSYHPPDQSDSSPGAAGEAG